MKRILLAAIGVSILFSQCLRADQSKVTQSDQLAFQQKTIQAQMQELQERMFHLAELTREMEPGDSAKLIMAVRKAREALIVEQMKDVLEHLSSTPDLGKADDEETQVLAKLEALKKLLMSDDLDLQMQLEQLKKLEAAIAKLDAATKEEKRQRDATGQVAQVQKQNKPIDPKKFDPMKTDQKTNHATTDDIAKKVAELGDLAPKAAAPLAGASQSMGKAEGSLGTAKAGEATDQQQDAVKNLEEARAQLDASHNQLLAAIESQVRKQVLVNLTEMLDRQTHVREASVALQPRAADAADRESALRVKQLALGEQHIVTIAEQTIDLINETQFSVALPPALQSIQRRCIFIVNDFEQGRDSQPTIESEKQVEKDLQDLIDTFKQLASSKMGNGNCRGCKGDKNKLLAELKVIRMLQIRVNQETRDTDGRRAAELAEMSKDMRDKIGTIKDAQDKTQDAMDKIRAQLAAP